MTIKRIAIVLTLALAVNLPLAVDAQEQNRQRPDRPYEVLMVRPAGGNQVEVVDKKTGEVVFTRAHIRHNEARHPREGIEWALSQSHVTALVDGRFELHDTLRIPVSNTSLIVGPNAELAVTDATNPMAPKPRKPIIKVIRRDNVNVFNLGTLTADWDPDNVAWGGIVYDGRNGGKCGIDGGLVFASGTVKNMSPVCLLGDTKNVSVPLIWSRNFAATVLTMEGNEDTEIGLAAGLKTSADGKANEVIDLNAINRRTRVHHLIGTWLEGQEEFLDVNNSPKTVVDRIVGYGMPDRPKEEMIGHKGNFVDIQRYGKGSGWVFTQKPYDNNNSPGTDLKDTQLTKKTVKEWKTEVETPGFPDSLPVLKIYVRLTAVFEDGSTEQVFANKYRFEL